MVRIIAIKYYCSSSMANFMSSRTSVAVMDSWLTSPQVINFLMRPGLLHSLTNLLVYLFICFVFLLLGYYYGSTENIYFGE